MIDEKKLMTHIENQYREWGEEYDAKQILGDIEDFPKVGEWIPCSERLPKNYENVLVSCQNGEVDYGFHDKDSGWVLDYVDDKAYPVLAWQPLPEPYSSRD